MNNVLYNECVCRIRKDLLDADAGSIPYAER